VQAKKIIAPNDGIAAEDDDVGVLVYRESQLRKIEAAVAAAESKKTSALSHHQTSTTRKRSPDGHDDKRCFEEETRVFIEGRSRADGCQNEAWKDILW
jgi:hypothetical protein